jgi:hypothetical protein
MIQDNKKKMRELTEEDISKYRLIGSAGGFSLGFCIYIAQRHTPNFFDRVVGYRIEEHGIGEVISEAAKQVELPKEKQKYITVSFYEEKTIN